MFVASSTWLCGYKGPAWRNTVPILRQLLAFSLAWLLIFGDLPAQAAMATTAAPVPKELSRSLRSSKDDYRNFDYELTAFPQQSGAPTIQSISPDNVPAGQTISVSGANFGNTQGTVTVAGVPAHVTYWGNYSLGF